MNPVLGLIVSCWVTLTSLLLVLLNGSDLLTVLGAVLELCI